MGILRRAAAAAFDSGGGLSAARFLNRNALRIMMYHRFRDRAALERQCSHLREFYQPVSLSAVSEWIDGGHPLPPNAVAVTVDDGYQDAFESAFPAFHAHGIPATIFVVTGFLDGHLWLWGDQVEYAVRHTELERVSMELPSGEALSFSLATPLDRAQATSRLKESMKQMDNGHRLQALEELPRTLGVDIPPEPPDGYRPITWDQARAMSAGGIEFGSHTDSHPILSTLADDEQLRSEVSGSKARIEAELGFPAPHFCYPNGRKRDFNQRVIQAVEQAGYRTAVTAESGLNHSGVGRFLLRRVGVEPELPEPYFRRCVAGVRV
jgi:peptidoglycan/xylan/chitin deacetylase (PgdA/CDA1 family)